jgi:hypothetical protein
MKIRFLYFKGCPNVEPALNLLKDVLKKEGLKKRLKLFFRFSYNSD